MRGEDDKGKVELDVFSQFVKLAPINFIQGTAIKADTKHGKPDILCQLVGGLTYFELAEICAPEFAEAITKAVKTGEKIAVWGNDDSENTLRKKLSKSYNVSEPIELLLYTDGRTALPNDVIAARLEPLVLNGLGPFRRIWLFFKDEVKLLAEIK